MSVQEVPRGDWVRFFDEFSRQHVNVPVVTEVHGQGEEGAVAKCQPLQGITAEAHEPPGSIEIIMGNPVDESLYTHVVAAPSRVLLEEDGGQDRAITIEATDGSRTVLRL